MDDGQSRTLPLNNVISWNVVILRFSLEPDRSAQALDPKQSVFQKLSMDKNRGDNVIVDGDASRHQRVVVKGQASCRMYHGEHRKGDIGQVRNKKKASARKHPERCTWGLASWIRHRGRGSPLGKKMGRNERETFEVRQLPLNLVRDPLVGILGTRRRSTLP